MVHQSKTLARLGAAIPERIKEPLRGVFGREKPDGLSDSDRRRLMKAPRFLDASTRLFGRPLRICDNDSFLSTHREIFIERIYDFDFTGPAPTIIDAGANIGLASIFFLRRFSDPQIIAIESDPHIFAMLRENLLTFGGGEVETIQGAAWDADEQLRFSQDHADGGRVSGTGDLVVQGIRLRDLLEGRQIDLLKLDIEGAEARVLADCADRLQLVERLFVEYHSPSDSPQQLSALLRVLEGAGMRYRIFNVHAYRGRPFRDAGAESMFDVQLNIFADRVRR